MAVREAYGITDTSPTLMSATSAPVVSMESSMAE